MLQSDATTFEIGEAKIEVQSHLRFSVRESGGERWYLIEDELRRRFYRIGEAEYVFISSLDGHTTVASAMAITSSICGIEAMTEADTIRMCKWLIDSGLANTRTTQTSRDANSDGVANPLVQANFPINPVSTRITLGSADRFAEQVNRYLGWLISWPIAAMWIAICAYAALLVCMDFDRLCLGHQHILSRNNLFSLIVVWSLLKLSHETAHVVCCKRFGGQVGRFGVVFLLFVPLPFVDVSSAWRFPSKSRRILTSAAGVLAELMCAAIAAIVWYYSSPGLIEQQAINVMFAASIQTLLFNANPLMRFDGYYILSDAIEIPNLAQRGHAHFTGNLQKWFFGVPVDPVREFGFRGLIVRVYGTAAFLWKLMVCLALGIAAANLFHGIGLIIAFAAVCAWCVPPMLRFKEYISTQTSRASLDFRRFATVNLLLALCLFLTAVLVPAPATITAPAIVQHAPIDLVRSEVSGFISEIFVEEGDTVEANAPLIRLSNPQLDARLEEATIDREQAKLRAQHHRSNGAIAAFQSEYEVVRALDQQIGELQQSSNRLVVRAPNAGTIISGKQLSSPGVFVRAGSELMRIGMKDRKQAVALVSQHDANSLSTRVGGPAVLICDGSGSWRQGTISLISPRAHRELPHVAFAAATGGKLDVVQREPTAEQSDVEDQWMLTAPRLQVRIDLNGRTSRELHDGQTGVVRLRLREQNLGSYIGTKLYRWVFARIQKNHGL